ncbi:copper homeostasis protein CutC [Glutamicibacter sp. NPDC127525]|uniref:copper homeostasis protein CutC n=1 Tax=unclassified Glutamicibacter TaxID=2627139 RepID=UPI00364442DA
MGTALPALEIVATSGACAQRATRAGADRLEACQALELGGLTPNPEALEQIHEHRPPRGVHALLRSRPGNFRYTTEEAALMERQAARLAAAGVDGIVLGALDPRGALDLAMMRHWAEAALAVNQRLEITVHRAIDASRDPIGELARLLEFPAHRVLSSGGRRTVDQGMATIEAMVQAAGSRIEIMCGGGLQATDIESVRRLGVAAVHSSAKTRYADTIEVSEQQVRQLRCTLDELEN